MLWTEGKFGREDIGKEHAALQRAHDKRYVAIRNTYHKI